MKILSVKKTAKVTRAMEAVSAVKMRKAQERAFAGRGYALAAMRILKQVSATLNNSQNPL
ncbi:MAG: synthase, partial [Candidatus Parcubacteria bacterium]